MELEPLENRTGKPAENRHTNEVLSASNFGVERGVFEASRGKKTKSSQRLRYEAEVEVIKRKLGSLEDIRNKLGLPQRKLCQLLLVDPSAWSRWIRDGESAPPHIYRMLQWYLALQEKYPALDAGFWLQAVARTREPAEDAIRDRKIEELLRTVQDLRGEIENLEKLTLKPEPPSPPPPLWRRQLNLWILFSAGFAGAVIGFAVSIFAI